MVDAPEPTEETSEDNTPETVEETAFDKAYNVVAGYAPLAGYGLLSGTFLVASAAAFKYGFSPTGDVSVITAIQQQLSGVTLGLLGLTAGGATLCGTVSELKKVNQRAPTF